jgi:hypothetical protein
VVTHDWKSNCWSCVKSPTLPATHARQFSVATMSPNCAAVFSTRWRGLAMVDRPVIASTHGAIACGTPGSVLAAWNRWPPIR